MGQLMSCSASCVPTETTVVGMPRCPSGTAKAVPCGYPGAGINPPGNRVKLFYVSCAGAKGINVRAERCIMLAGGAWLWPPHPRPADQLLPVNEIRERGISAESLASKGESLHIDIARLRRLVFGAGCHLAAFRFVSLCCAPQGSGRRLYGACNAPPPRYIWVERVLPNIVLGVGRGTVFLGTPGMV